jgi:hypothetical protein
MVGSSAVIASTLFDRVPVVNLRAIGASGWAPADSAPPRAPDARSVVVALASRDTRAHDDARLTVTADKWPKRSPTAARSLTTSRAGT